MKRRTYLETLVLVCTVAVLGWPTTAPAEQKKRVMIVLTNTAKVPGTGQPTGVWASEYTDPYEVFSKAGFEVHVYSPLGGMAPIDPRSGSAERVKAIPSAWQKMQATKRLTDVRLDDYAAVFLAGGHGTMWDFPQDPALQKIVENAFERGLPLGAVCHGPAGLLSARKANGTFWISGRSINGFTNAEERAAGMTSVVPFLLEDRLRSAGGRFESAGVFARHLAVDGTLVTGQNPASADAVAEKVVELIRGTRR